MFIRYAVVRYAAIGAALAGIVLPAAAQGRPDARTMSCAQVQALITARGAVVLTTGRHTYDRYVVDTRFCYMLEVATATTIPTKDTQSCMVFYCASRPYDDR